MKFIVTDSLELIKKKYAFTETKVQKTTEPKSTCRLKTLTWPFKHKHKKKGIRHEETCLCRNDYITFFLYSKNLYSPQTNSSTRLLICTLTVFFILFFIFLESCSCTLLFFFYLSSNQRPSLRFVHLPKD